MASVWDQIGNTLTGAAGDIAHPSRIVSQARQLGSDIGLNSPQTQAVANAPGNVFNDITSALGNIPNALAHPMSQWPLSLFAGSSDPPTAAQTAWSQLQSQPLTGAQVSDPSNKLIQQYAQAIGALPASQATTALKSLPSNLASDVQNYLSSGGTSTTGQQSGYQYGFDPLSMKDIFSQSFQPFTEANQKTFQNQINDYNTQMQAALQGASPQIRQAYQSTDPGIQAAATAENQAAGQLVTLSPAVDSLIQGLSDATTAAKSAQQYASVAPYYQGLVSGYASGIGGTGTTGALGVPTTSTTATTATDPFAYGIPGQPTTTSPVTQNANNNLALQSAALTGAQPTP